MSDHPPMSLETKLSRRGEIVNPNAATQAENFVDDVTTLRIARLRMPSVKPELFGLDNETIKAAHLGKDKARLERWGHHEDLTTAIVDVAYRFTDGSIAIRIGATQRWEVMRTW